MNATPTIEARDMLRNPSIGLRRTGAAIVLALFFAPVPAVGRQTTDDPELARLKIEAEKAAKRAEIAESEKKIREASIPAVSPVVGKTEIDQQLVVEVQVLAHRAVSTIADRIAALVGQKAGDDATIVLLDAPTTRMMFEYRAVHGLVVHLQRRYEVLNTLWNTPREPGQEPPSPAVSMLTMPAAIGGALQQRWGCCRSSGRTRRTSAAT